MQFLNIPDLPLIAPDEFLPREIFDQAQAIVDDDEVVLVKNNVLIQNISMQDFNFIIQ